MIAALTAPMADGVLYKVDMRLRHSGQQGPLATSLPAFRRYQAEEAWTWEHMALTRARVVAGPPGLSSAISTAISEVLTRPHNAAGVIEDAASMRRRLAEAHADTALNPWETKLGPGRMMDIELLAQAGAITKGLAGQRRPRQMLHRLGQAEWIGKADAAFLVGALDRLATLQQLGRLASDSTMDPADGGDGFVRLVLAATGEADLDSLRRRLVTDASRAAAIIGTRLAKA